LNVIRFPQSGSVPQWLGIGFAIERSWDRLPASPLSNNNYEQVVHTHVSLSPSSRPYRLVLAKWLCSWEGNYRFGVALAMCHRLSDLSTYELNGLRKGDEDLTYVP